MKIDRAQLSSFLATVATLLLAIDQALGCNCRVEHPQQQVCRADFVVRGEILKRQIVLTGNEFSPTEVMYTVQVKRIYKGEEFMPEMGNIVHIYTPDSDAVCGLPDLEKGKYLLSALYDDYSDQLRTRMCLWNVEWSEITQAQRQGLKHFYNKYCQKCEIDFAQSNAPMRMIFGNAPPPTKSKRCWYDGNDCERLHSSCIRKSDGSCGWTTNKNYRHCKGLGESS